MTRTALAAEFHVSVNGSDNNDGSSSKPYRTISKAAEVAQPGDVITEGTRITGNLCCDNSTDDLYVEVDHGPYLVDNNLFLSGISLFDMSEGGAYAHNLMTGKMVSFPERARSTPYHQAHSTALAGLKNITGGDNRFYNNILVSGTGGDQARDHRVVGEGQDSGAPLRECRRLAPGHRHRLFRQAARQGETVRRAF